MLQNKQISGSNTESSQSERSRATPVLPAVWITSVLVWATVVATFLKVPAWVEVFLCSLTGLSFLSYLVPYTYLMINDRDALRRERFQIKGSATKQLVSVDTVNEKLITEPKEFAAREAQLLERK